MKKIFLILVCSLFISNYTFSTHLMGGEITYTCVKSGPKTGFYVFNVIIYRDCQGIPIDTTSFINVHNHPTLQTINLNYIETNDISPMCDTINGNNLMYSCGGNNIGYAGNGIGAVEEHIYRSDTIRITGAPDSDGWHFTWSDCCRNGAIINIDNPSNYGFTLRTAMYSYTDSSGTIWPNNNNCYDNSPNFYEKPRTILETFNGFDPSSSFNGFTYSHNAYDSELDSISYQFAPPLDESSYDYLNPNSTAIPFSSGFDFNNPINQITLDPISGRTFYPASIQGNYVTCTKVSSYRCGQLISEVFREIQVVLTPPICNLGDTTNGNVGADTLCNIRPSVTPPFYYPNQIPQYQWDTLVHCGDTINFDFIANDYDFYPNGSRQDLLFEISGGQFYDYQNNQLCDNPPCATFTQIGTNTPPPFITSGGSGAGHFEWITDCSQLSNGCYTQGPSVFSFVIKVSDDFCPAPAIENTSQVITITVFPPCDNLKSNYITANSSCNINDGSVSINPSGGFSPYLDYYSDLNGVSVNPDSLISGTYILRLVDSTMCERVDTFTIVGPSNLDVNSVINDVSCSGGNDGNISLITNNNVSYVWSNGDTTNYINMLSSGNYSVTYSDTFGCSESQNFQINEPTPLNIISNVQHVTCNGANNGQINLSVNGGISPYLFNWSNGDTSDNIINLSAGTYGVSILDSNSCLLVDTFSINQPNLLISQLTGVDLDCFGDIDGMIMSNVSGGLPPYSYLWSTGDTSQDLYGISSGNYVLSSSDSNGCVIIDSIFINQPNQLIANIVNDSLGLTGSVTGGASPYIYEFYSPSGLYLTTSNSQGSDVTISTTNVGYYSLVITDANGCVDSVSILYGNNFSPNVNISLSNYLCDSLSSLTIAVSQDSGQVDMSTALFQSNSGYFDIQSLNVGDTIGTADLIAAGGNINVNTMLVVSTIISSNQAIISPCSWSSGCLGSFTITNIVGGGVEMISQSVPDGNNYTLGNSSTITFENLFVNPCTNLVFTTTINSELGDTDIQTISYNITSVIEKITQDLLVYPNPNFGIFTLEFNNLNSENIEISIYNSINSLIYMERISNINTENSKTFDISNYSKGIYIIRIVTDDYDIFKKIILH